MNRDEQQRKPDRTTSTRRPPNRYWGWAITGGFLGACLVALGVGFGFGLHTHEADLLEAQRAALTSATEVSRELDLLTAKLREFSTTLPEGSPEDEVTRLPSTIEAVLANHGEQTFEAGSRTKGLDALRRSHRAEMDPAVVVSPNKLVLTTSVNGVQIHALVDIGHVLESYEGAARLVGWCGAVSCELIEGVEVDSAALQRVRTKAWTVSYLAHGRQQGLALARDGVLVEHTVPRPSSFPWWTLFLAGALLLVSGIVWVILGGRLVFRRKASAEAKDVLVNAAAELVRHIAATTDIKNVLAELERALNVGVGRGVWTVLTVEAIKRGELERTSAPPDELRRILDDAMDLDSKDGSLVSQTIATPKLDGAGRVIFVVRDVGDIHGIAICEGGNPGRRSIKDAGFLLRIAAASLRSVVMLQRLVTSEQQAAVGRLAAGVAHEVNNPLAYLVMNLKNIEPRLKGDDQTMLEEALDGADRINQVLRGLRVLFRGPEELEFEQIDLVELAEKTIRIANARRVGTPIVLEGEAQTIVEGDELGLSQIVLNLVTNAIDAVRENAEPQVTVKVYPEEGRAFIEVADNGPGVPESVKARIFEAFVTSKGKRGTGLGLGIARSFAKAHSGTLELRTSGPEGAVFRLSLPLAIPDDEHVERSSKPPTSKVIRPGTPRILPALRPRILIIDDEAPLIRAMTRWLRSRADVTGTTDPAEGLELAATQGFSFILSDLNMPTLSGADIVEALKKRNPAALERFVIMTGSVTARVPGVRIVNKPVDLETLDRLLEEAITNSAEDLPKASTR